MAWAAFECLAADLWETIVNKYPQDVMPGALQLVGSDSETGLTSKTVPVSLLLRHGLDLRDKLGTVLRARIDFSNVSNAKKAYLSIAGRYPIDEAIFDSSALGQLEALRHVIVHRNGVVDGDYLKRTGLGAMGQVLDCPLSDTYKLVNSMLDSATKLIRWVDHFVVNFLMTKNQ